MRSVSVESLKQQIRVALDENRTNNALSEIGDVDTLSLDELIESKIEDAAEAVIRSAPIDMIGDLGKNTSEPVNVHDTAPYYLEMPLPSDFLRLIRFKAAEWTYGVHEVAEPTRDTLMKLHSPYGVLGTVDRPVVLISPSHIEYPNTEVIPAYLYGTKIYRPLGEDGKLKPNATSVDFTSETEVKGGQIQANGVYRWQNLPNAFLYYVWQGDAAHYEEGTWEEYTPDASLFYKDIDTGTYYKWNGERMNAIDNPDREGLMLKAFCVTPSEQTHIVSCTYAATPKIYTETQENTATKKIELGERLVRPTVYYAAYLVSSVLGEEKATEKLLATCKEMLNLL